MTTDLLAGDRVQRVKTLAHIDQKFHGCFGHRFLEENFAMYWQVCNYLIIIP